MNALTHALCRLIVIMIALLVIPAGIMAQDTSNSEDYRFGKEELTQMLAPIALYPDALTAQILMASTYPLEVVEADRWRSKNRQLKGDDLDSALQSKTWDPSVKSLCHFPDILNSMSDKLDQTRKLGDAFLNQEEEVMATIQELRKKAMAQGNLKTTDQQKVVVEDEVVKVEPASSEVVYVPVYDPAYVYGPWWYPAYPPYYWYYPSGFYGGAYISFGPGIYFGFNAFSWAWFDWPTHRVHTDLSRTRHFNRNFDRRDRNDYFWRHNPAHRRGVAYRDLRTSERFGSRSTRISSPSTPDRRGYPGGRIDRQITPQAPQTRQAPAAVPRASGVRREGIAAPLVQSESERLHRPVLRDTPFSGVGAGSFERRAGERGGISNRSHEMRQPSGGFSGGGGSRGVGQERGSRR